MGLPLPLRAAGGPGAVASDRYRPAGRPPRRALGILPGLRTGGRRAGRKPPDDPARAVGCGWWRDERP